MYRFDWYSPAGGGRLRAMHCMDIPFVFDTIDESQSIVGSGADRRGLADRMSGAWVAFARTGNPNHALLPKWEPFAPAARQTMMLSTNVGSRTTRIRTSASPSRRRRPHAAPDRSEPDIVRALPFPPFPPFLPLLPCKSELYGRHVV